MLTITHLVEKARSYNVLQGERIFCVSLCPANNHVLLVVHNVPCADEADKQNA